VGSAIDAKFPAIDRSKAGLVFERAARLNTRMGKTLKPLLAIVLAAATSSASAEPVLVGANPASHATFAHSPDRLRLYFSEPTRISGTRIQRSARAAWTLVPTTPGAATAVSLPLPYLLPGKYVVTWQRTSGDGRSVQESTSFNVR
jgi:methionine-rich copper-binding protein CopC